MLCKEIIKSISQIKNGQALLYRSATSHMHYTMKYSTNAKSKKCDDDDYDKPVKYSTSEAANWPACGTGTKGPDIPRYQTLIIMTSLALFLIYFGILREENDIDQKLTDGMSPEAKEFLYGLKLQQEKQLSAYRKNM
ncbi:uncharacterized protein LOC116427201 [Nomia melanderi]|uniref:uncharacterized protein LOC116427201 n=1 Tax=Nomia melanderi TaxID=2448451 RepID=UPI00130402F6|nr:uncharacterized protein LOC116427201 [Nomia melanderi]